MKKGLLPVMLVFCVTIVFALSAQAESTESSVVSLFITYSDDLLIADQFFEIIDQGEHILLPLISFADYLGIDLESDNINHIISVLYQERSVQISTRDNLYVDHPEWSLNPPLFVDGILYVAPQIFEHLTQAQIEWRPNYQEIAVQIKHKPRWLEQKDENSSTKDSNNSSEKVDKLSFNNNGLNFIRYRLKSNLLLPQQSSSNEINWQLYGRVGNFSLSAFLDTNLSNLNQFNADVKMLRAKYEKSGTLLVIGDHESTWEDSLDKRYIRGATFSYSQGLFSNSLAYRSFAGEVQPYSTVSIYVKDKLIQTLSEEATKDGSFSFSAIPLTKMKLNTIKIVIREPSGKYKELNYQITGEPRIFLPNTYSFQAAHGLYRSPNRPEFEGVMSAYTLKLGGNGYSIWTDGISYKKAGSSKANNGFRLSFYGQPFGNVILDANAFLSPDTEVHSLGQSIGLKLFSPSFITTAKFYNIPPAIVNVFPQKAGLGNEFTLTISPAPKWLLEIAKGSRYIEINNLNHKRFHISLGKTLETPSHSQVNFTYFNENLTYNNLSALTTNGLQWNYRERTPNTHLDRSFIFKQNNLVENNASQKQYQELEVNASGSELVSKNGLLSHSFNYQSSLEHSQLTKQSLNVTTTAKGTLENITGFISLSSLSGSSKERTLFEQEEFRLRFLFDQVINKKLRISSNTIRTWKKNLHDTFETQVSINYTCKPLNVIKGELETLINLSGAKSTIYSGSLEYKKTFANSLSLSTKFKVSLSNPSHLISYLLSIDISQALGLSANRVNFFSYSEEPPKAFLTGRAYIDWNENGQLDKGEPVVSDVPIRLDNNIVSTEENGVYRFEDIEPGEYLLSFDEYSLPADYTQVFQPKLVIVKEYESVHIDLPLVIKGSISGTVFIDINENGRLDAADTPISLATVILNNQEKTLTNTSGNFTFDRVKLGTITLAIDPKSLPPQTVLPPILTVTIDNSETELANILIPVHLINKPVLD